jgi:acetolactate synthase-1/2/3 large subunit
MELIWIERPRGIEVTRERHSGAVEEVIDAKRSSRDASPSRRAAAAVADALAAAGSNILFGVPGGGWNLDVIGAAADVGIDFVLAHGETAAAIMGATYAQLTGAPGAVVATRGPGLASAVNGLAHALLDRLPLVADGNGVDGGDRWRIGHQQLDQIALGRSVAKTAVTVGARHGDVSAARAVEIALCPPRGPVVVNFDPTANDGPPDPPDIPLPGDDLMPLRKALAASRRPVVALGLGAADHVAAVRQALVGSGVPVLHTYRVRGLVPDSCGEAAGLLTGGTMEAPLLEQADLVIGLGIDPVELIPAAWSYSAPTVLVSEVPTEAEAYFTGARELLAPLPHALDLIRTRAGSSDWPADAGRATKEVATATLCAAPEPVAGTLTPQAVVATVRSIAPPDTIATVDAGAHMLVAMPLWTVDEPHRLLISSGLATMGYALPAAIAAALCNRQTPVVAFSGDGGLGMTLMEIETAVRYRLRVILVVFNDAALSLIKIKQQAVGQGGDPAVSYGPTDFAAVARAMGATAGRAADAASLREAVRRALTHEGPTVIDVAVDPSDYPMILDLTRGQAGRDSSR